MIQPPALVQGDTVAIISTARKIDVSQMSDVQEIIESWGYKVRWGNSIRNEHHQFCGTDEERATDLQSAINDQEVKAIICFRGGYGTIRVLDKVNLSALVSNPKWIVGYSDVTALHGALHREGVMSVHGTMPVNFSTNTLEALDTLKAVLTGGKIEYKVNAHELNRSGEATAELVGGNLSMIYSMTGTPCDFDFEGKILFIEDLDEYLYHIDRMMQNLKQSGVLSKLQGLIVGGMTDMNDNAVPFGATSEEIIAEAIKDYNYPVCFDFPAGHIDDNRALVIGKECELIVSDSEVNFMQ